MVGLMLTVGSMVQVVVEVLVVVGERRETRYVPVIVVLTFLPRHYIWK